MNIDIILIIVIFIFILFIVRNFYKEEAFINNEKTEILLFYASWCPKSKEMLKLLKYIESRSHLNNLLNKFIIRKIDVDENKHLTRQLKLKYVPSLRIPKTNQTIDLSNKNNYADVIHILNKHR